VKEQVEQKQGAHKWMVVIGVSCLSAAVVTAILGRVSGSSVEKVGTTTTTKAWPSETLITSLLAVGAVLVIVGFLWARITSIKVAGAEIGLSDDEKKKVAAALTQKVPEDVKPEEAATAAMSVVTALAEQKAAGAALTDAEISKAVEQHTQGLASNGP
jgi:hypothetical protein